MKTMKFHRETLHRETGGVLILVMIMMLGLMTLSVVSTQLSLVHSRTLRDQRFVATAKQISDSAVSQGLARIKSGGELNPWSGSGMTAGWVDFSSGHFYYDSEFDPNTDVTTLWGWGRVMSDLFAVPSTLAPDSPGFDGAGWTLQGTEITISSSVYVPDAPLYFGNGGIQLPDGGFLWTSGADPADPSTWPTVPSGSGSSSQDSSVPFEVSALEHPQDFIANGGTPAPANAFPHPYSIWASQNLFGQLNVEAWFENSAGSGSDPTTRVTPTPDGTNYNMGDPSSPDYPYPVDTKVPDVQIYTWALWSEHKDSLTVNRLVSGSHDGSWGNLANPAITFVTGTLLVNSGDKFDGVGILVIRDDFDPATDSDNTPATRAWLDIQGTFEWTGLVIVSGWAPTIRAGSGSSTTIVGALFGEDSVMSGGETSLDSATIGLDIDGPFKILWSHELFQKGGIINPLLPRVIREVVGIREL